VVAKILHRMNQMTDELGRLQRTAAADDLTGVMRRGAGMDALARELDRASRGTHQLVVAFLDLDGLKSINDTLGHAAGDQVIRQMASVVRGHLRSYDFVVRWGGDEFLCVLPDAGIDGARRLLRDTSLTMARNGGATFSAGFAVWERGESTADLIARADQDLYRQRQHRRQMDLPA
jgi:diguanylate cyclase (GGDEF)-like protein